MIEFMQQHPVIGSALATAMAGVGIGGGTYLAAILSELWSSRKGKPPHD